MKNLLLIFSVLLSTCLSGMTELYRINMPNTPSDDWETYYNIGADGSVIITDDDEFYWYDKSGNLQFSGTGNYTGGEYLEIQHNTEDFFIATTNSGLKFITFSENLDADNFLINTPTVSPARYGGGTDSPENYFGYKNEANTFIMLGLVSYTQPNQAISTIPSNAVVIPSDSSGPVQIILESSEDMVNWNSANPGTYGASTNERFFRVRAVEDTE